MYGNEHRCTYNQLLAQKIPNIYLNRQKGFYDLIGHIEKKIHSEIVSATVYARFGDHEPFDMVCRNYYEGKRLVCNDEWMKKMDEDKTLYYFIKDGRVVITETNPNPDNLDFRACFENKL